jgi:perosamine synthetase
MTYIATANAAKYCGASVIFADIDPTSWVMDPDELVNPYPWNPEELSMDDGDIAIPVHMYDAVCPVSGIPDHVKVIEDAAHAPGTKGVGSMGDLAAFSFYGSKVIACGEGGMVTTDDDELADLVTLYRGQGARTPGVYHHDVIGYNYRMTDMQAAVALAQLYNLPTMLEDRRAVIDEYTRLLSGSKVQLQGGERASGWMMAVVLPTRSDKVAKALLEKGIETRPFFKPLPSLPPYDTQSPFVSEDVAERGICLPTHTRLSLSDISYVCECLLEEVDT